MEEEAKVRAVTLFFFFSLLDESAAKKASLKAATKILDVHYLGSEKNNSIQSKIVYLTNKIWQNYGKEKAPRSGSITSQAGWVLPANFDLGLWQNFVKDANSEEYLTLLWSKVLNFSDSEISSGLGVTEGTVRHRVGRALKTLGELRARASNE